MDDKQNVPPLAQRHLEVEECDAAPAERVLCQSEAAHLAESNGAWR